jgi:hypothetical protein
VSLVIASVIASVIACGIARADDETDRARALFDEAGELERQGQWGAAQERLRAALRLRETPHLRYALGWALENDDKLLEARGEYEAAARLAQRSGNEDVARLAVARVNELVKKTPVAAVHVPGGSAAGTRVVVDGRSAPLQNDVATISVNPGSRVVRIESRGRPPIEQLVYVLRGTTVDVEFADAVARNPAAQDRPAAVAERASGSRDTMLPWILVGGGAVLVIGGAGLLVSSGSDAATRDENTARWCTTTQCTGGNTATIAESAEAAAYRRSATEAAERGNTKQGIGFALGAAGLVTAAIGTYLLFRGETNRTTTVRVSGAPLPGGAMAGAGFVF